jgi:hypothetical protein
LTREVQRENWKSNVNVDQNSIFVWQYEIKCKGYQLYEIIMTTTTAKRLLTTHHLSKVGSIKEQTHQTSTDSTSDRNSHDPGKQQETNTLEVNGLERSVAETDTDSGTSDTHRGRDREGVLREHKDSDGSTHFHGGTTAGGVIGDLVTHDCLWLLAIVTSN